MHFGQTSMISDIFLTVSELESELLANYNIYLSHVHTHPDMCVYPLPAPAPWDNGTDRTPTARSSYGCSPHCLHDSLLSLHEATQKKGKDYLVSWFNYFCTILAGVSYKYSMYLCSFVHLHPAHVPAHTHSAWSLWYSHTALHSHRCPSHTH